MIKITKNEIEDAISEGKTMNKAAELLGLKFNTFKRHAQKYDLYKTNQGGKGITRGYTNSTIKFELTDILKGKHPTYQTGHLKRRLIKEGLKENKCEECGIGNWNGKELICQLDHRNGISDDHRYENLIMLCPNCHSQTDTYCGRNK